MGSLMQRAVIVGVCLSALASAASAGIVIDIQAYIDGRDQLIIQGGTLQWHHLSWDAVGRTEGGDEPTILSVWEDGALVLDAYEWIPTWSAPPPDPIFDEEYSSVFTIPGLSYTTDHLELYLTVLAGRESLTILQAPSEATGWTSVVDFDDNVTAGADWYRAVLAFPVPEPATMGLLGLGLGVLALKRRRVRK